MPVSRGRSEDQAAVSARSVDTETVIHASSSRSTAAFDRPVLGAYPGHGSAAQGQAQGRVRRIRQQKHRGMTG